MRRIVLVILVAAGFVGVWWLAEDGNLRHRIGELGGEMIDRARGTPPPSWADVAERVGEFAAEERDLKQTVGRLDPGSGEPPGPADPASE